MLTRKSCAEAGTPVTTSTAMACCYPRFSGDLRRPGRHGEASGFALEGVHAQVDCQRCHRKAASGRTTYRRPRLACASCHRSPHGSVGAGNADCGLAIAPDRRPPGVGAKHDRATGRQGSLAKATIRQASLITTAARASHRRHRCMKRCRAPAAVTASRRSLASRFRRLPTARPCHKNVHGGSFGARACRTCHSEKRELRRAEAV